MGEGGERKVESFRATKNRKVRETRGIFTTGRSYACLGRPKGKTFRGPRPSTNLLVRQTKLTKFSRAEGTRRSSRARSTSLSLFFLFPFAFVASPRSTTPFSSLFLPSSASISFLIVFFFISHSPPCLFSFLFIRILVRFSR